MGISGAWKTQLGKESSAGTAVAATTIWRGPAGHIADDRETLRVAEDIGILIPTIRDTTPKLAASISLPETDLTFEQAQYISNAGIQGVAGVQDGAGSDYIYTSEVGYTAARTLYTYTVESGDDTQAEEMEYGFVRAFNLKGTGGGVLKVSSDWSGRQASLASFTGALSVPAVRPVYAAGTIYIDDDSGNVGTTPVSAGNIIGIELAVNTGWETKYFIDTGQKYFQVIYFNKEAFSGTLKVVFEHATLAETEKAKWRANTARLIRLKFPGAALVTPGTTYSTLLYMLDMAGSYTKFNPLSSQNGNSIIEAEFSLGYSSAEALALKTVVVNELSALP